MANFEIGSDGQRISIDATDAEIVKDDRGRFFLNVQIEIKEIPSPAFRLIRRWTFGNKNLLSYG